MKNSKGAPTYLPCKGLSKINMLKFVAVPAPDRANVLTSKNDVTAQSNFFQIQDALFTFQHIYKASTDKTYDDCFSVALKIAKKHNKIKATSRYLSLINNTKTFHFLFTLFKLTVAAPDITYAPTSKKYVTTKPIPL